MKQTLTLVATLAVGFFAASHVSAEPVLLNGSFESPALPPGTSIDGGGDDWTFNSQHPPMIQANGVGNNSGETTPYGSQYLSMVGIEAQAQPISDAQTIADFEAGVTYVLGVDFAGFGSTPLPTTLTISVSGVFNGSQTYTAPNGGPYPNGTIPFTSAVFFFTPLTSGSATIKLTNSSFYSAIAVDNVSLYGNASIPEPTSIATLLLGAGILGLVAVRRRLDVTRARITD
jgi:hypothetical protein